MVFTQEQIGQDIVQLIKKQTNNNTHSHKTMGSLAIVLSLFTFDRNTFPC